ncbi:MAG: hypothetical protein P8L84_05090 [Methylococcaceae bacterium]|nr:hypothetical protein [Methylococcaceae bacterium]
MFFFKKLKQKYAHDRLIEDYLYQSVCQELKSNYVREGLWAKAQMNSGGDLNLQKSLYIKYRKQILKDELKQTEELNLYGDLDPDQELSAQDNVTSFLLISILVVVSITIYTVTTMPSLARVSEVIIDQPGQKHIDLIQTQPVTTLENSALVNNTTFKKPIALIEQNQLFYVTGETQPFTGEFIDYQHTSEQGEDYFKVIKNFSAGKLHGLITYWNESKRKIKSEHYQKGLKQGISIAWTHQGQQLWQEFFSGGQRQSRTEFSDGNKITEIYYQQDKKHGPHTIWYPNGQKKQLVNYVNDQKHGWLRQWRENGLLASQERYKLDVKDGQRTEWGADGNVSRTSTYHNDELIHSVNFVNRQEHGKESFWYNSGEKKAEVNYNNGKKDGIATYWLKNGLFNKIELYGKGKKYTETNYHKGKKSGLQTVWFSNGKKKKETHYKNGKEEGIARFWYKTGKLKEEKMFRDGYRSGLTIAWDQSGRKNIEKHYKMGQLHGRYTLWDESGNKGWEMYYKLGKQDGLNTMWYPNGQKKWEILYIDDIINKSTFWNEEGNITKTETLGSITP